MKLQMLFWMLVMFLVSCTHSPQLPATNLLVPKENIKHVLDSFITINGEKSKVYELYIDKISPNEYNLIIYCGSESLTKQEDSLYENYPLNVIQLPKIQFKIYSGIEHFFHGSPSSNTKAVDEKETKNYEFKMWTVKDSAEVLTIQDAYGGYPFMPFPNKIPDSLSLNHSSKF